MQSCIASGTHVNHKTKEVNGDKMETSFQWVSVTAKASQIGNQFDQFKL